MQSKTHAIPRLRLQSPTPDNSSDGIAPASADFRDRLQSVRHSESKCRHGKAPTPELLPPSDVVELFRVAFLPDTPQYAQDKLRLGEAGQEMPCSALKKLADTFAQAGSTIHATAVQGLVRYHAEVQERIDNFIKTSSALLEDNDALYSNAEYSLAQTRCSTDNHPCATVAEHLARLETNLRTSEERIAGLAQEWDRCRSSEREAWGALETESRMQPNDPELHEASARAQKDLEKEGRKIMEAKSRLVDDIHEEFMQKIQVETESMFDNVMF